MSKKNNSNFSEIEMLHELFQLASDNAGIGLFYYDAEKHPHNFYAQDKTIELIGGKIRTDKLYSEDVWINFMKSQDNKKIVNEVLEKFEGTWSGKYELYDVEYPSNVFNPPKWLAAKAKVTKRNKEGKALNMIGMLMDITEQKNQRNIIEQQKKELELLAYRDQLTGLKNRLSFYEDIKVKKGGILFIDLDKFKSINDIYGHEVGDYILKSTGDKLTKCTDGLGMVPYRLAGDEFVIKIDADISEEKIIEVAENIIKSVSQPTKIGKIELVVSCSLGVSFYAKNITMKKLIEQADVAMYTAKRSGRNQYVIASENDVAFTDPRKKFR